jgi:hypothetical protein
VDFVGKADWPQKLAATLAAGALAAAAPVLAAPSRKRSKLVIWLMPEALRYDTLIAAEPWLRPGGLRRLMEEGSFFPDCSLNASSFSSSALATLQTGAYPAGHGIVADRWAQRSVIAASPARLQATTLSEQVRLADTRNRTFWISSDTHLAELGAGLGKPEESSLYGTDSKGKFQLSAGPPNTWLTSFAAKNAPDEPRTFEWRAMHAAAGAPPLRSFRVDAAQPQESLRGWQASPFGLSYEFDFLTALIRNQKLGRGPAGDLVTVVLDSFGKLARAEGGDSPLMRELLLHLDSEIENLLAFLTADGVEATLAMTSLHGAPDTSTGGHRVSGQALATSIEKALATRFGPNPGRRIETYIYPFLYLKNPEKVTREMRLAAGKAALAGGPVQAFYTADGDCSHTGEWAQRMRNSFHATRSGDVMLSYLPGYLEDTGETRGVSFGSLYNYDVRVPAIFWGPGFSDQDFEDRIAAVDVAPTLARVLDVAAPSSSVGRVLAEVFTSGMPGPRGDRAAR